MKGLGQKIKALRKLRKLTLVEIAKTTGIDQATLSRIENDVMTGTLDSHMKVAKALGVHLTDLYEDVLGKINEAKDRAIKQKLEAFSYSSGTVVELLTTNILQKKMMPVLLKIKARGNTENEEYPFGAEKFVYTLKGSVEITVDQDQKILKPGESLYFNAALPHHFTNGTKSECWILSVVTPSPS
ncbi:MAG: hypothetical protein AUJ72_00320 [Candidatus Omnitrophica bacterium CG1_02_46_14]|nr:MAG: hypothetical protein AUJ72_00320 [Candidatus Omnitrophica bacterium CG1_02_46_14]